MNKNILYFILSLLLIIILNLTINSSDLFSLLIVTTLYIIFISSFNHLNYNKKTSKQILPSIIIILFINIIYFIITYLISTLFFIEIRPIFISMASTIFILPSTKIVCNYLTNLGKKKSTNIIKLVYILTNITTIITLILLYHFINLDITKFGVILFLTNFIPFIFMFIYQKELFKPTKINLKEIKSIFYTNIKLSIITLSNQAYYYLSLMFLYFTLTNNYLYQIEVVSTLLIDVYLYCYFIVLVLYYIYIPKDIDTDINTIFIKIMKKMLPITIFISILSGPILTLLFNNSTNANILTLLIFESIFLVLYNICMKLLIDKKNFNTILSLGLIIKCIITVPLIHSLYRMGYSMVYGDILSTIISLLIPILITTIYFNNKNRVNFGDYFYNIISIVYENIILCLILILLQLLVPLNVDNRLSAILVILMYTMVFLLFNFIKVKIRRLK